MIKLYLFQIISFYLGSRTINKKRFYKGRTTHATNTNLAEFDELKEFNVHLKEHAKIFIDALGFDYEKIRNLRLWY